MNAQEPMQFKKAQKAQSRLRLALTAVSGGGKTESALRLARGIVGPKGRIAVADTERGSASLYADRYDFDVLELEAPYSPEKYAGAIMAAERAGYDILILDSITHEWKGRGGVLEIHSHLCSTQKGGNSYTAWAGVTPRHQNFIDTMLSSKMHIIATIRAKTAYIQGERNGGKKFIEKAGEAAEQRDGIEFEFTSVLDISVEGHLATVSKDRTNVFDQNNPTLLTEEWGEKLKVWLESGIPIEDAEWKPSPKLQDISRKWIERAAETQNWEEALSLVPGSFSGKDAEYMNNQLELAKEMLTPPSSSPQQDYAEPNFGSGVSEPNLSTQNGNEGSTEQTDFVLEGMDRPA